MNSGIYRSLVAGLILMCSHGLSIAGPDYFSFSVGQSTVDTGVTGLTGSASLDEKDSSLKLIIGANMNPGISFEGFYLDYGEAAVRGNAGDQFAIDGFNFILIVNNAELVSSATAIGASVLFDRNLTTDFSLYAELGIARWDSEFTVSGAGVGSASVSETGTDPYFGVGFKYRLNERISLAADYEVHEVDEADIDVLSVYLIYMFQK